MSKRGMAYRGVNTGVHERKQTGDSYTRFIRSQGRYYSYDSQAYAEALPDWERSPIPARPSMPRPAVQPSPRPRKRKRQDVNIQKDTQIKHRSYMMHYLLVIAIFGGVLLNAVAFAANVGARLNINSSRETISKQKLLNQALLVKIEENYDSGAIETIAINRLGMQPSQEHQVVSVAVPKQGYFVQYDDLSRQKEQKPSIAASVIDFLTGE